MCLIVLLSAASAWAGGQGARIFVVESGGDPTDTTAGTNIDVVADPDAKVVFDIYAEIVGTGSPVDVSGFQFSMACASTGGDGSDLTYDPASVTATGANFFECGAAHLAIAAPGDCPTDEPGGLAAAFGGGFCPLDAPVLIGTISYIVPTGAATYDPDGDPYVVTVQGDFIADSEQIPLPNLTLDGANVTIPNGQCCAEQECLSGDGADGQSTEAECADLDSEATWNEDRSCADPCTCVSDDECDDSDPCTEDACDDSICVNTPIVCDDEDSCTEDDCVDGECEFVPIECDDGDACTDDSCDPETGCVFEDVDCDDGDDCTIDECDPKTGDCTHETPDECCVNDDCGDDDPCTDDTCDNGNCVNTAIVCDDDDLCTEDDCVDGECEFVQIECDDDDPCTEDRCDPETGCVFEDVDCDDGDDCTVDACDPGTGDCAHEPVGECCNDADCDDTDACTDDACIDGECEHDDVDCDDGDLCTIDGCDDEIGCVNESIVCADEDLCTTDFCNPDNGECVFEDLDCDDGVDCTMDECVDGTCDHTPDHGFCDDEDICTDDSCESDVGCVNSDIEDCCEGQEDCDEKDVCDDNRCRRPCEVGNDCDDDNDCTDDECVDDFCEHIVLPDGTACEDGFFCTINDSCIDGVCVFGDLNPLCQGPPGSTGSPGSPGSTGAAGADGTDGSNGSNGANGLSCWDLDSDGIGDPEEDINQDGNFDSLDCQGVPVVGGVGLACWDLNANGVCDPEEDIDGVAGCDARDCQGTPGADGVAGAAGSSCWDLDGDGIGDPEEDINDDGAFNAFDCLAALSDLAGQIDPTGTIGSLCGACGQGAGSASLMMLLGISLLKFRIIRRRRQGRPRT